MSKRMKFIVEVAALVVAVLFIVTVWVSQPVQIEQPVPIAPVITGQPSFSDKVEESRKGVVHIMCPQWQGSGFFISPRIIVTARHCVEGVEDFTITTYSGCKIKATRAISMRNHDVALIYIDDPRMHCTADHKAHDHKWLEGKVLGVNHKIDYKPLPLGSIKKCRLGQNVYVIGSPFGKVNFNSVSAGIISKVDADWSPLGDEYGWEVAFTVDSAGHPGNSGCPVFTNDGVVRGILVGGFSPSLISVMPCDLFGFDLPAIRLMFIQDKYYREEAAAPVGEWYNYSDDSEYY